MKSTIVAFMQNMWVRDPERVKQFIAAHPEPTRERYRRLLIARLLFMGCLTGRRLQAAFGDVCDSIVWEESTREIAGDPKTIFPPDLIHIRQVLAECEPSVVLTFGKIAWNAVK